MYAIAITQTGGPDVLTYVEMPILTPGPHDVLIKAEAIGVNFIDTYFRSRALPARAAVHRRTKYAARLPPSATTRRTHGSAVLTP